MRSDDEGRGGREYGVPADGLLGEAGATDGLRAETRGGVRVGDAFGLELEAGRESTDADLDDSLSLEARDLYAVASLSEIQRYRSDEDEVTELVKRFAPMVFNGDQETVVTVMFFVDRYAPPGKLHVFTEYENMPPCSPAFRSQVYWVPNGRSKLLERFT